MKNGAISAASSATARAIWPASFRRPNRPAGLTSSTIAMTTKITVFEAGVIELGEALDEAQPEAGDDRTMIEPMPPMTTTEHDQHEIVPISADPLIGAASTPASCDLTLLHKHATGEAR